MNRFIIAPSASRDLDRIAEYFLERNVNAGEKLFRDFNQKCFNLLKFPNLGRSYNHIRPNLRGLPLDGYIIFYQVVDESVEILRIVNGRQDLETLFADEA
ncbi:type II toxin-antitoxin system RelE/ParE family toxin [Candidatus Gracilibacteria bacterium]|jgi:toxin ParE1/3/4|nr:type II toxin-antitoxin system RelE/ParE family toxin [Candidatus Gracilibacteria bacterium]NJM89989.1 type II toxin-antitoxin system RelE/ParE family toxin [Hydrococcus sp. RU_2_2]NJP17821.1 type II toxin-antitoxin system RelE/ParE family toxin [Hydrococcus sp. CRU_1_1]NJQ98502.1 type II toxin-antitoxin system RelE/ParE family toxin [Hydrococcus sp. CSU_1_8]